MLVVLIVQLLTYLSLGVLFIAGGNLPLGMAQLLLAGVQALLFGPDLLR